MLPVILSGGQGSRLWPLSTPSLPKQFLSLIDKEQTMIQQTIKRIDSIDFMSSPLVICNEAHLQLVKTQLQKINQLNRQMMLEPVAKNTAPAIIAASLYCRQFEEDGTMLVLPSDHTILNIEAFKKAIDIAHNIAKKDKYALFGIVPTRAETGYGYIETSDSEIPDVYNVSAFKEKPDLETANKYIAKGNYFWNSGMFAIPANLFLKEIEIFDKEMLTQVESAYNNATKTDSSIMLNKADFEKIKGNSIDYAVMEKTKNAVVIPLDASWSDVGSWNTVWELSEKDINENSSNSNTFFHNSKNNLVHITSKKNIALLGINDCVIIESDDGILIADMKSVQNVKNAAENFSNK